MMSVRPFCRVGAVLLAAVLLMGPWSGPLFYAREGRDPTASRAQLMPPHPSLEERIRQGEVKLPSFMLDPAQAASQGLESPQGKGLRVAGPINALAVVVDFSDKVHTVTATYFDTLIYELPKAGLGSVRDYFDEVSYGQVDIVTVNLPSSLGWVRAPSTYNTYVNNNYCTGNYPRNCQKLAEDIVDAINGVVNFANYDNDGDGQMEPIMLIHAGPGAEYTGNTRDVWSHSWGLRTPRNYDGVTIARYTIQPEYWLGATSATSDMTIGVFAHEMGHGFWGLPDLYDRDGTSYGIGDWSLMAGGSWNGASGDSPAWPDAWSRVEMGFVTPVSVGSNVVGQAIPQAYDNPAPVGTVFKLTSESLNSQEYFLVENRQRVSGSYDGALPGEGLFIWHVDGAMDVNTLQNDYECTSQPHCNCSDGQHFLVALEQADGSLALETKTNQGDAADPFPGSANNRTWTYSTDPESSSWYACGETCIQVTGISDSSANMTANLQVTCPPPVVTWIGTTSSWSTGGNWTGGSAPGCGVDATIPASPTGGQFPTVDANAEVASLVVESGAQVNMSANSLGICGDLDVQGSGLFNATGGTVTFKGSGGQSIQVAAGTNGQFYHLQLGDGAAAPAVAPGTDLEVDGNLTIASGAALSPGTHTLQVAGNWTDYGTFAPGTGTVVLDGGAQTVLRQADVAVLGPEGFETAVPPAGWTTYDVDGGGNQWVRRTDRAYSGNASAAHLYHATQTEDGWLRTPLLSLTAGPELRFWENVNWTGDYVKHSLWACTAGCANPPANYAEVVEFDGPAEDVWVERVVDLGAYAGQDVYLAFRYQGQNATDWYIDDVQVTTAYGDLDFYNLTVDGSSAATLAGNLAVQNDLTILAGGLLDAGTYQISGVGGLVANSGGLRQTHDVPNATTTPFLTIPGGKYYGLDLYPTSGSMGATTVTVYGNQTCPDLAAAINRCFEISPAAAQTADITFYYRDAEENGHTQPEALHWNGVSWEQQALLGRDLGGVENNWVRAGGVSTYSPFALANWIPTSVSLLRFEAFPARQAVRLAWETASEAGNVGFHLYRSQSPDGERRRLNRQLIPSQAPGSSGGAVYDWLDERVALGVTYYYWLEDVDLAGRTTLHGPVSITIGGLPPSRRILPSPEPSDLFAP